MIRVAREVLVVALFMFMVLASALMVAVIGKMIGWSDLGQGIGLGLTVIALPVALFKLVEEA